jgi:YVTN family beta-propeller protein
MVTIRVFLLLAAWTLGAAAAQGAELLREGAPVYAYVFNVGSKDVTVIDTATHEVVATRPLGVSVRWLSNEQDFWDGEQIWTYDIVEGQVELIAIDPVRMTIARRLTIGKGPAHSVMLTPDRKYVMVNAAGDNVIAVVARATLKILRKIETGLFPCDLDFASDGAFAYFPERDQHTVATLDLSSFQITNRVSFPKGSKPHMLRVAPDDGSLWIQTAAGGTNDVLDPASLETRSSNKLGKVPVTTAWTPDGRQAYVTHIGDAFVSVMDARSFEELKRIPLGSGAANIGFRPDGRFAYVSLVSANKVAVIDTEKMEVVREIPTGTQPFGLIVMSPPA